MLVLSGERISELDRVDGLRRGDELLVSRHYNLSSDRMFSKRIEYDAVVDAAVSNLRSALNLSSAAFEEKSGYSRKNHGHGYSNVYVYTRYPDGGEHGTVQLARFETRNNGRAETVNVFAPYQAYDEVDDSPRIGELKFMLLDRMKEVDVSADDFDGWVYPDGAEYSAADFPEAWLAYRTDPLAETFRVPTLSSFVRLNPGVARSDATRLVEGNETAIPAHGHGIQRDYPVAAGGIKATVNVPAFNGDDASQYDRANVVHAGQNIRPGRASYSYKVVADKEYSVSNVRITGFNMTGGTCQFVSDGKTTFPTYNTVPAMIYIGRRGGSV